MSHAQRVAVSMRSLLAWRIEGAAVLAASMLAISPPAGADPTSPFNYVVVDLFGTMGDARTATSSATDEVTIDAGTAPAGHGTARTDYGSNGFAVQAQANGLGAGAGSIWSDRFRVEGGTGLGVLALSAQVVGSITGQADMSYALFVSLMPFDAQAILAVYDQIDFNPQLPNANRLLYTAIAGGCGTPTASAACGQVPYENVQGPVNLTLAGSFAFPYNTDFYLASVFGGDVSDDGPGGSASFLNSATFGISLPPNAIRITASGTDYLQAVPEPQDWLLLSVGLAFLACVARRRRPRPAD